MQPPCTWTELAQSDGHCDCASKIVQDWKSRVKWCSGCTAPAKWKRLPYFCPGLVLSCCLRCPPCRGTANPDYFVKLVFVHSWSKMAQRCYSRSDPCPASITHTVCSVRSCCMVDLRCTNTHKHPQLRRRPTDQVAIINCLDEDGSIFMTAQHMTGLGQSLHPRLTLWHLG